MVFVDLGQPQQPTAARQKASNCAARAAVHERDMVADPAPPSPSRAVRVRGCHAVEMGHVMQVERWMGTILSDGVSNES
jgi:hypothetical protein